MYEFKLSMKKKQIKNAESIITLWGVEVKLHNGFVSGT